MTAPPPKAVLEDVSSVLNLLVTVTVQTRASDLHLRAGSVPFLRVDGRLSRGQGTPVPAQLVEQIITATSGRDLSKQGMASFEFSYEHPGACRFRGHAFKENGNWAITLRVIPIAVPTFQELRLPPVLKQLSEPAPGLVLITGPTGSGKSTSAAALLRAMAATAPRHVVTVEDPVEYQYKDVTSCVTQREVGRDTESYRDALEAAFREDPDILFIGEIRNSEALEVALQAAESGIAVVSTMHTATTVKTVQRLVSMFPSEDQQSTRNRLADVLRAVVAQRLLPRKGTKGRVLCCEVALNDFAVKACIREEGKLAALPSILERSADRLMQSFDRCLVQLVSEGLVAPEVALAVAVAPADIRRVLQLPGLEG